MKKLLQQALDALEGADSIDTDMRDAIEALGQELEKPEPEPVTYMLTTRNFGLGGET